MAKTDTKARKSTAVSVPVLPVSALSSDDLVRWSCRLDDSIGKLAQATSDLSQGVAAHSLRLNHMEQQSADQREEAKRQVVQHRDDYRYLDAKITTVQSDLTIKLEDHTKAVTAHVDKAFERVVNHLESTDQAIAARVGSLERVRWIIGGGGIVIGTVLTAVVARMLVTYVENHPGLLHFFLP